MSSNTSSDPLDIDCPFCGAEKGKPCRSVGNDLHSELSNRELTQPHTNRIRAREDKESAT